MADSLTERYGIPISAGGVRAAARRGDIPHTQRKPGASMLFDADAVFAGGYRPNRSRGDAEFVRCSNVRCKEGPDQAPAMVEVSAYARRNYRTHFCSWECKYAGSGAWNPGGGRKGPRSTGWRPAFLQALADGATVAAAAATAGVGKVTPYRHRANDDKFRVAWDAALPTLSARRRYWVSDRSSTHKQKLGDRHRGPLKPPLERALCSPTLSEKRERRKTEYRQARRLEIAAAVRADPQRSNRSFARELHRDARLVGVVRHQLESAHEIPPRLWGAKRQSAYSSYPHRALAGADLTQTRAKATSRATGSGRAAKRSARKLEQFLALLSAGETLEAARKAVGWGRRHAQRMARDAGVAPRLPGRPRKLVRPKNAV